MTLNLFSSLSFPPVLGESSGLTGHLPYQGEPGMVGEGEGGKEQERKNHEGWGGDLCRIKASYRFSRREGSIRLFS